MDKIKGVVFLIESLIKSSKKQLLSKQILIDPDELGGLLNKLTEAIDEYELSNRSSDQGLNTDHLNNPSTPVIDQPDIIDIQKEMIRLKKDANDYADSVLSRLQLAVTKLQQNVIKMETNITEGRKLIQQKQLDQMKGE
ncbi:MAG: hypothetical protein ACON35_04575 [Candidatus Marinamargulisbacteria bacterium]